MAVSEVLDVLKQIPVLVYVFLVIVILVFTITPIFSRRNLKLFMQGISRIGFHQVESKSFLNSMVDNLDFDKKTKFAPFRTFISPVISRLARTTSISRYVGFGKCTVVEGDRNGKRWYLVKGYPNNNLGSGLVFFTYLNVSMPYSFITPKSFFSTALQSLSNYTHFENHKIFEEKYFMYREDKQSKLPSDEFISTVENLKFGFHSIVYSKNILFVTTKISKVNITDLNETLQEIAKLADLLNK